METFCVYMVITILTVLGIVWYIKWSIKETVKEPIENILDNNKQKQTYTKVRSTTSPKTFNKGYNNRAERHHPSIDEDDMLEEDLSDNYYDFGSRIYQSSDSSSPSDYSSSYSGGSSYSSSSYDSGSSSSSFGGSSGGGFGD